MKVYNSNQGAVKRPRRRIGQRSNEMRQYLNSLSPWQRVQMDVKQLNKTP